MVQSRKKGPPLPEHTITPCRHTALLTCIIVIRELVILVGGSKGQFSFKIAPEHLSRERERERERQTDRQTDRERQRHRERDTHTHTQRKRQKQRPIESKHVVLMLDVCYVCMLLLFL